MNTPLVYFMKKNMYPRKKILPKRPPSAYFLYQQDLNDSGERQTLKELGLKSSDISKIFGERYQKLPESDKLSYRLKADKLMNEWKRMCDEIENDPNAQLESDGSIILRHRKSIIK